MNFDMNCDTQFSNNLTKGEHLLSGKSLNDTIPMFRDIFEVLMIIYLMCIHDVNVMPLDT